MRHPWAAAACVVFCLGAPAPGARADPVADFYDGKTVSIIVGYAPGGGYDQSARILAKTMPKYIPGAPRVVVQNMPGAGTLVAANYVNNAAPRDGTVIGMYADLLMIAPLIQMKGVQFDPPKLGWLGTFAARSTVIAFVRSDAPATTMAAARNTELLIGATGPDATSSYAYLMNDLFGTKLKVVQGYKGGTSELHLAVERGEIHGQASQEYDLLFRDHPDWFRNKFITVLMQFSPTRNPDLKDVPTAMELAKTEEERQILDMVIGTGQFLRSFSLPPGAPADRLAALREAFTKTVRDPDFVKELTAAYKPGITYQSPEQIMAYLSRVYSFPPSVAARAAKYVAE